MSTPRPEHQVSAHMVSGRVHMKGRELAAEASSISFWHPRFPLEVQLQSSVLCIRFSY